MMMKRLQVQQLDNGWTLTNGVTGVSCYCADLDALMDAIKTILSA